MYETRERTFDYRFRRLKLTFLIGLLRSATKLGQGLLSQNIFRIGMLWIDKVLPLINVMDY